MAMAALSAALAEVSKNDLAWTYTICGFDGSPYITRTMLPRAFGYRPLVHKIWRADEDSHMHNHPWMTARFMIVSGGYVEERMVDGRVRERRLRVGDVNALDAGTFHRVAHVEPNTWTVGIVGERVQDWGFMVDGEVVPWQHYFARRDHVQDAGSGAS